MTDLREALFDAAHDANKLVSLANAMDALHASMPATRHPDADVIGQRATDGLAEVLEVLIARAEALASRLDRLAAPKAE